MRFQHTELPCRWILIVVPVCICGEAGEWYSEGMALLRPLHGELHQGEPPGLGQGVPQQIRQSHPERPVRRLHAGGRPRHEEACPHLVRDAGGVRAGESRPSRPELTTLRIIALPPKANLFCGQAIICTGWETLVYGVFHCLLDLGF